MNAESASVRGARKDDHVQIASDQRASIPAHTDFDDVSFMHHALDAIDAADVRLSTPVADWVWSSPYYINGMTGGTAQTGNLNRELAIAARETGLPMASGSVSIALDAPHDTEIVHGFTVIREENPDGFVMANLGVDRTAEDAMRAVDLLQANALQVHLNAVQETVMPEGSRNFSGWLYSLEQIIAASPVPVIVKEVGFGLSRRTLERLTNIGVQIADVSGKGGTDFLAIENTRRSARDGDYAMLTGYGQSAIACLLDAPQTSPVLLASGGVRNPFDGIKALASGAAAVGVAGTFLESVRIGGAEALIDVITQWHEQTTALLALLGANTTAALTSTDLLVQGSLAEHCQLRGIDIAALARRSAATMATTPTSHSSHTPDARSQTRE